MRVHSGLVTRKPGKVLETFLGGDVMPDVCVVELHGMLRMEVDDVLVLKNVLLSGLALKRLIGALLVGSPVERHDGF